MYIPFMVQIQILVKKVQNCIANAIVQIMICYALNYFNGDNYMYLRESIVLTNV